MRGMSLTIGVLALQGDVREHVGMVQQLGAATREVRRPDDLHGLQGIILPGGESTAIGKLLVERELLDPLRQAIHQGLPAYGTCAGMILMAAEIEGSARPWLGVIDITVQRNAFGSQLDSFEQDLTIAGMPERPFHAIFIRAPRIERVGPGVELLAALPDGTAVAACQGHMLVSAFHPELGRDTRFHERFLATCAAYSSAAA